MEVQATVKNVGSRAGDEVAQLYVTDMYASVKTRVMELKDFARIHLQPGESKMIFHCLMTGWTESWKKESLRSW